MRKRLSPETIAAISSTYLREGRKLEAWELKWVEIEGDCVYASVAMTSLYTTRDKFHLTIFATLEFASQLMIIYGHDAAGLERKEREGWMVESTTRTVRAIRDPDDISVVMKVRKLRTRDKLMHCVADFTVTDAAGGLFEVTLTGFLA